MNGNNRQIRAPDGEAGIVKSIIAALRQSPAYLVIFAVIFLNYAFCIFALSRSANDAGGFLAPASLASLLIMTVVAVVTVKSIEGQKLKRDDIARIANENDTLRTELQHVREQLSRADDSDVNIIDPTLKKELKSIINNVREATVYENEVFRSEVMFEVASFGGRSEKWSDGAIVTDPANYEKILQDFYRAARHTVFATSNEQYMDFWGHPSSQNIVKAHKEAFERSHAHVTRVFVFSTFCNISREHLARLKTHAASNFITTKVFIADETPGAALGSILIKDFVIIDEGQPTQAIGITNSFEIGAMGAQWVVKDEPDVQRAAAFIKKYSLDLSEVENRIGP